MISTMTKYSFLVYHKEYDSFLKEMRELGVLHVIQKQEGIPSENGDLQEKLIEASRFDKALKFMSSTLGGNYSDCIDTDPSNDGIGRVANLENLLEEQNKNLLKKASIQKEIDRM